MFSSAAVLTDETSAGLPILRKRNIVTVLREPIFAYLCVEVAPAVHETGVHCAFTCRCGVTLPHFDKPAVISCECWVTAAFQTKWTLL